MKCVWETTLACFLASYDMNLDVEEENIET